MAGVLEWKLTGSLEKTGLADGAGKLLFVSVIGWRVWNSVWSVSREFVGQGQRENSDGGHHCGDLLQTA